MMVTNLCMNKDLPLAKWRLRQAHDFSRKINLSQPCNYMVVVPLLACVQTGMLPSPPMQRTEKIVSARRLPLPLRFHVHPLIIFVCALPLREMCTCGVDLLFTGAGVIKSNSDRAVTVGLEGD